MKQIVILVLILLTVLVVAQAQRPAYYDTFGQKWLDPAKWVINGPDCVRTLECVREIQNGQLREALRNFGASDSDSGDQWDFSQLYFVNPNAINSITTDVTLRSFSGTQCSTNAGGWTHASIEMGGIYFNTGTGDPYDDVSDIVALVVDPNNPKTIGVSNWMSGRDLGVSTDMGSYPLGTTLTVTITWDKANHHFISVVKVKDDPSRGMRVVVPYNVPDTNPPANPRRWLATGVDSPNCTSAQTFAQVETFYDNVMINQ